MSVIRQQTTSMTDKQCLTDALKAKGFTPTVLETPETIRGHYNERSADKCDIVLKKEDHKRQADIGFAKQADGTYKVVTDTWVNRDLQNLEKWTNEIKVEYTKAQAKKIAKAAGFNLLSTKVLANGKTRLQFARQG